MIFLILSSRAKHLPLLTKTKFFWVFKTFCLFTHRHPKGDNLVRSTSMIKGFTLDCPPRGTMQAWSPWSCALRLHGFPKGNVAQACSLKSLLTKITKTTSGKSFARDNHGNPSGYNQGLCPCMHAQSASLCKALDLVLRTSVGFVFVKFLLVVKLLQRGKANVNEKKRLKVFKTP